MKPVAKTMFSPANMILENLSDNHKISNIVKRFSKVLILALFQWRKDFAGRQDFGNWVDVYNMDANQ